MAQLLVRNLEEELVRALQVRAAEHGRSTEAEHREILREALAKTAPRLDLKAFLESMPNLGEDADFERDRGSPGGDARDVDL
jgi:plasmid stability protein